MADAEYELKVALVDHSATSSTNGHTSTTLLAQSPSPSLSTSPFSASSPPSFPPPAPLNLASPTNPVLPLTAVPLQHRHFLYLLCVIAFFVTFRPSEPYLTQYLMDDKGLGAEVVNEKVYPVWTYSYFAFLLPVGLAGEWLGHRAVIGAEFLFLLVTYVILIWGEGLQWMQFMQVTFGFTSAAQSCVFFTYIYHCCPPQLYHTAVSQQQHTRRLSFLPTATPTPALWTSVAVSALTPCGAALCSARSDGLSAVVRLDRTRSAASPSPHRCSSVPMVTEVLTWGALLCLRGPCVLRACVQWLVRWWVSCLCPPGMVVGSCSTPR